jgi:hemoglobin
MSSNLMANLSEKDLDRVITTLEARVEALTGVTAANKASLFDRIGGEAAVDAPVELFSTQVLADDRIKHFFEGVDMNKMRGHQKKFITMVGEGRSAFTITMPH